MDNKFIKKTNSKGFTLIEVIAVVIILGVLLLIAVPSISNYIAGSRKSTYVNQMKQMVNTVASSISAMKLPYNIEENEGIIVPFDQINLEKGGKKSPYSEFNYDNCFILVVYNGKNYDYYISALDNTKHGFKLIDENYLTEDSIVEMTDTSDMLSLSEMTRTTYTQAGSFQIKKLDSNSDGYIKVLLTPLTYEAGDVIVLNDNSKWYVINDAKEDDSLTVNVLSYYNMSLDVNKYGEQDAGNPTVQFHYPNQSIARYDENASIYPIAEAIISATNEKLGKNNINLGGATVKMPEKKDFCSATSPRCNRPLGLTRHSEITPFWSTDTSGSSVTVIFYNSFGGATTANERGIRMVIKNLSKDNIDWEATNKLNS